jgi:hypothetical protein
VLDIDIQINRLRTAKNYLYILASVIYYTCVLAIEKLLSVVERKEQTEEERD